MYNIVVVNLVKKVIKKDRIHLYYRRKSLRALKKRLYLILPSVLLLIYGINNFLAFSLIIEDDSMEPHIKKGQRVFFSKTKLGFRWPFTRNHSTKKITPLDLHRGDILAFENPHSKPVPYLLQFFDVPLSAISLGLINLDPRQISVKRVIGLPGDTLKIIDKQIYLNQNRFDTGDKWTILYRDERIFPKSVSSRDHLEDIFIPNGYVYVLSDNWDFFNDSRIHGLVPYYKIEGIAIGNH